MGTERGSGGSGDALEANPGARAVLMVHSDTSTGVLNPVAEVASVARAHGALTLVDGISSIAGAPFEFDGWYLDFAVVSSQKCLMSSPGICPGRWWGAGLGGRRRRWNAQVLPGFWVHPRTLAGPVPKPRVPPRSSWSFSSWRLSG